jgi:hypothetical protein
MSPGPTRRLSDTRPCFHIHARQTSNNSSSEFPEPRMDALATKQTPLGQSRGLAR